MSAAFWAGAAGILAAAVLALVLIRDRKTPVGDEEQADEVTHGGELTTAA